MNGDAPLFRLIKVNEDQRSVTASLWESNGSEWLYNGNLTMLPESFAILKSIIELGGRRCGLVTEHVDRGWIATETGYTRKEWSL